MLLIQVIQVKCEHDQNLSDGQCDESDLVLAVELDGVREETSILRFKVGVRLRVSAQITSHLTVDL